MMETINTAAVGAVVGLVIGFFFKRWNREYITKKQCDGCREEQKQDDAKFSEFKREMREGMGIIKGLLLVIASGGKVTVEDLKELMK